MWPVWAEIDLWGRPVVVTGYGLLSALGALLGTWVCVRSVRRFAFGRFDAFAASALALAFGLIGARLLYVAVSWREMGDATLWEALGQGGLVWYGGLLFGAVAAAVYCRAYRIDVARFGDACAPGLALGHAMGRLGCFTVGCCWGAPTSLPWGVRFPASRFLLAPAGVPLHPVQLYEAAFELAMAGITFVVGPRLARGRSVWLWLASYAAFRLAMELGVRGDNRGTALLGVPPSAWIAGAILVAAGALALSRRAALTREKNVV